MGGWTAASPPFPQERLAHIFLLFLWFSPFAHACSLCTCFEPNISTEKWCGLTCLIFPSLSCKHPSMTLQPMVMTPLPGFLLPVTLCQTYPELLFGGGIFLALDQLSLSLSLTLPIWFGCGLVNWLSMAEKACQQSLSTSLFLSLV